MNQLSTSVHVDASPEACFARASDFPNAAQTIAAITKIEMLTEGPVGKGTRFRETRVMFGREATETMEVTEFDPPRQYALGAESHGCRYHSELRFEPESGGTRVTMTFAATPLTFVAKVMSVLLKPMSKMLMKQCLTDLNDLKRAIEGT